eukprot:m.37781 g.37781  ORF g.37781 m.37781 type:complete len:698 (-) comp13669_c0_seq1:33-2126(-)
MATVVAFDRETYHYNIQWDDGDPTGRVVHFSRIALDIVPQADEIAVGSHVAFPQGSYVGTDGHNTGGQRYHQGVITRVWVDDQGVTRYDGHHTETPEKHGKMRYRAYKYEFEGLLLKDLRLSPNVLDILLDSEGSDNTAANDSTAQSEEPVAYDIFLMYHRADSRIALANGEMDDPPPYHSLVKQASDPRVLKRRLEEQGFKVWLDVDQPINYGYSDMLVAMTSARCFVACVSNSFVYDETCRMQFQFAKKSQKKPVIPLVVEAYQQGPPWDWQMSVVGLLLAGELYIDFTDISKENDKFKELIATIRPLVNKSATLSRSIVQAAAPAESDVFVSYCWNNSHAAYTAGQITRFAGTPLSDPRSHAQKLKDLSLRVWLDVWCLQSGREAANMFEQIAAGLRYTKCVVAFVSSDYARSDNCRMEIQFAAKSLKKPIIPIICGEGDDWSATVVGMLVHALPVPALNMQGLQDDGAHQGMFQTLTETVRTHCGSSTSGSAASPGLPPTSSTAPVMSRNTHAAPLPAAANTPVPPSPSARTFSEGELRAPRVGDHVVAHHINTQCYYMATVVGFDKKTMSYQVNWDDGDPSGRVMPYDRVALDLTPREEDIGVGSLVVFPQGKYGGTQGNNTGGVRYHQGEITAITEGSDGSKLYHGHHTETPEEGKKMRFRAYVYEFNNLHLADLRVPPNAMDALMMFQSL